MTSLYLTYDGLTDPLGQSQILPYILGLEEKGVTFHIVSFEKKEAFDQKESEIKETIGNKNIHWHPLFYHKRPPVLSTLFDLSVLTKICKKLVKEHAFQIVHCRSYLTSLIGLQLKKKYHIKFLFDMRGFWADERVEGKIWNTKNPLYKLIFNYFKRKELDFFEQADAIISLTDTAKEEIQNILSPPEQSGYATTLSSETLVKEENQQIIKSSDHQIFTIPCCTDLELFNCSRILPSWKEELNHKLKGDFQLKIIYVGSLGTWYMLQEMLDFFEATLNSQISSQFIFLTKEIEVLLNELQLRKWKASNQHQIFNQTAQHFTHPDFFHSEIVVTKAERSFVPYFIDYSDASILFIKPSYSKKASSATKMGEALALNKPVITNINWGDVELLAKQSNSVLLVEKFDQNDYKKVANQLMDLLSNGKIDALNLAQGTLSLQNGIEKYFKVYKKLSP